jgi:hypothetical protein
MLDLIQKDTKLEYPGCIDPRLTHRAPQQSRDGQKELLGVDVKSGLQGLDLQSPRMAYAQAAHFDIQS